MRIIIYHKHWVHMDVPLYLCTCSNCPGGVSREFIEFPEFIDRFKVGKLEWRGRHDFMNKQEQLIQPAKSNKHLHSLHFSPPANEGWGKVIFLHLFVILFTGVVHGPGGGAWSRGVCAWSGRGCMVPGGCLVPGGWSGGRGPGRDPPRRLLLRAVRILLECILVCPLFECRKLEWISIKFFDKYCFLKVLEHFYRSAIKIFHAENLMYPNL